MNAAFIASNVRRQVQAHPRMILGTSAAFCLLALVAGGARLGSRTVDRWGAFVGQNVHLIVYLADDIEQERALGLRDILRRAPAVAQVTVIEPAQALARLNASALAFGSDGKALDGLEPAYFPRSLEVSLAPAADLALRASDLAKRLRGVPGVAEVDAMTGGLARLSIWVRLGRTLGLAVLLALGLVALLALVTVFLRSRGVVARRAAVLAQLGETPTAIRLPSGLWTAMAALAGGGTGALLLIFTWRPLLGRLESSLGIVTAPPSPPLAGVEIAVGLAAMVLAGLVMGYFAAPLPPAADHG
jgi:cell division protein FtsX